MVNLGLITESVVVYQSYFSFLSSELNFTYPSKSKGFNFKRRRICFKSSALTVTSPEIPAAMVSSLGVGAANAKAIKKQTRKICGNRDEDEVKLQAIHESSLTATNFILALVTFQRDWCCVTSSDGLLYSIFDHKRFFMLAYFYIISVNLTSSGIIFIDPKNREKPIGRGIWKRKQMLSGPNISWEFIFDWCS